MSSGIGAHGGVGRCMPFWNAFSACLEKAELPSDCMVKRDDYYECLHHRKRNIRGNLRSAQKPTQNESPEGATTREENAAAE